MTTPLAPCPACQRHLRIDASVCAFCRAAVEPSVAARPSVATHVSRAAIIAMGTLAAVGCSSSSSPDDGTIAQPYGAPPTPMRLNWTLAASQSSIKMADRGAFRLTIAVANSGGFAVDPMRSSISFKVNGQASNELDLAFSNGVRGPEWGMLPAGATATDARDIGMTLFPSPGKYVVELLVNGDAVSQVSVDVAAD
jgi:hypothetical protein